MLLSPRADPAADAPSAIRTIQAGRTFRGRLAPARHSQISERVSGVICAKSGGPDGQRRHDIIVLDAHDPVRHGGTGRTIDWQRAARVAATRRVLLAGGLTAANVGEAIRTVRPYGVDVASGIEQQPGIKDAQAMQAFVTAVRTADEGRTA